MNSLRKNLMITLLIGIPTMAVTDFRVWSDCQRTAGSKTAEAQPPIATTRAADLDARRLPEVNIGQQAWFSQVQQRLRACGATYVRLERWNTEQPIYHFRCDLKAGASAPQSFEALSGSPRAAVHQVLRQATDWYASNSTSGAVTGSRRSTRPRLAEPGSQAGPSWR